MSELTERREAATRQHSELQQRRREIRRQTAALKQGCRLILSRPSTLATAFLAGGLLGFGSHNSNRHRPPDSMRAGQTSRGNSAKLGQSLQTLAIQAISRSIVQSLIPPKPSQGANSPAAAPDQGAEREPSR